MKQKVRLVLLISLVIILVEFVQGFGSKEFICSTARLYSSSRDSFSSFEKEEVNETKLSGKTYKIDRRDSVGKLLRTFFFGLAIPNIKSIPCEAACLAGDTSKECIGYYKVPIDDAAEEYFDTSDNLEKFAPDLKWVPPIKYPKTYKIAREELVELQIRVQNLRNPTIEGYLTDTGTEILGLHDYSCWKSNYSKFKFVLGLSIASYL